MKKKGTETLVSIFNKLKKLEHVTSSLLLMFLPTTIDETVTKENKTEPYSKKKKKRLPVLQSVWTAGRAEAIWCRLVDSHPEKKQKVILGKTKINSGVKVAALSVR